MKDRTLTRTQRRMPLMHQPLLSDAEVADLIREAAKAAAVRAQSERSALSLWELREDHHGKG